MTGSCLYGHIARVRPVPPDGLGDDVFAINPVGDRGGDGVGAGLSFTT